MRKLVVTLFIVMAVLDLGTAAILYIVRLRYGVLDPKIYSVTWRKLQTDNEQLTAQRQAERVR